MPNLQAANKSKAADQVTDAKLALEGSIIEAFNRAVDGVTNASGLDSLTLSDAKNALKVRMASGQDAATAATTTLEELKQRETAFGFIPVGGSVSGEDQAKLDAQIAIIQELAGSVKSVEERRIADNAKLMIESVDKNRDRSISGDEASGMLLDLNAKGQMTNEMRSAVANADKDRSGLLSPKELTDAMIANEGFRELLLEMRAVKEAIVGQQPKQQRPPQPAVRPKEAPLPAATAP